MVSHVWLILSGQWSRRGTRHYITEFPDVSKGQYYERGSAEHVYPSDASIRLHIISMECPSNSSLYRRQLITCAKTVPGHLNLSPSPAS